MMRRVFIAGLSLLLMSGLLQAQTTTTQCTGSNKLGCLIPNVYGPNGLTLPNPFHEAHFENDFQTNFSPLNASIATELTLLRLASPASGFTYTFDRSAGVYSRTAQSFGPILAERAETLGKGKFYAGVAYQYFSFNSIDGIDLGDIPAVFKHELHTGAGGSDPAYENDFITTQNSIDLFVNQITAVASYGLTNRIDLSVAVPVLNVNLGIRSDATIHRTAPPNPTFGQAHYFDPNDPDGSVNKTFSDSGHASGIGDVTVRVKGTVLHGERAALGFATDVRFPTGDELNFLGAGAYGVQPFVIGSVKLGKATPHVNLGYQFNGDSILAGDILTGTKARLPRVFYYTVGTDVGVSNWLTLAFDLLGQRAFGATTVSIGQPYVSAVEEIPTAGVNIQSSYRQIELKRGDFNVISGSAGFKMRIFRRLLMTQNVLFQLNNDGLRAKVVPVVGLSYTF
jgi:hypothetical protein